VSDKSWRDGFEIPRPELTSSPLTAGMSVKPIPTAVEKMLLDVAIASGDQAFFTRREIKHLPEMLVEGEHLLRFASGMIGASTWLIALTSKRILFLNVGLLGGLQHTSIFLDKVNAISGKEGMVMGKIFIRDGAGEHLIDNVPKATVASFVHAAQLAQDRVQRQGQAKVEREATMRADGGKYDRLEKIFRLKEMGAITLEEYEREKVLILRG
jgi:hypothetical protein